MKRISNNHLTFLRPTLPWLQRLRRCLRIIQGKELYYPIDIKLKREFHGKDLAQWCIVPDLLDAESIVYSFGVGTDLSFDLSLIEKFGLTIFGFDPTPLSISWAKNQKLPKEFRFFEYGVADQDTSMTFYPPSNPNYVSFSIASSNGDQSESVQLQVSRLTTIMNELGHEKIDLLKMDIEGAEYGVVQDMVRCNIQVKQLLVEFHHRLSSFSIEQTQVAVDTLHSSGFKIFNISPTGEEYSFIKEYVDGT